MRIGIAHYSAGSDISGVTTWLAGFCEHLAEAGHEVGLHLHHFGADPNQASIRKSLNRDKVEIFSVRRSGFLERDTRQTICFLNHFQPGLFLPQCLDAHYFAATHAGRQGLAWVLTMHSDDPAYWLISDALVPKDNGGAIVCVSQYLAYQVKHRDAHAQPVVIPYGISLPPECTQHSAAPFRVVYSGRMVSGQKCIQQVVKALIAACRTAPCIEADLMGDGPERSHCERMVSQAGFSSRIRFLGRLDPHGVQQVLKGAHSILLMSDFEGLPVALLEAMAFGVVPVVRAIQSGIPELVEHEQTGLLVANDPVEAAMALIRLAKDQALWDHCSVNARSRIATSYSAEQAFDQWEQLIHQHAAGHKLSYPVSTSDLRHNIPFDDRRFQAHYPLIPALLSQLHLRIPAHHLRHLVSQR